MIHLVIVRTGASVLNLQTYNCQELGLAKALTQKGIRVSLVMAGTENSEQKFQCEGGGVNVYLLRFISIDQRYGYFLGIDSLLRSLSPDIIQVHDLGVFMTWYVSRWARKNSIPCYLIQGTYQISPQMGIKQVERLYYKIFARNTIRNISRVGCKTKMASRFISHFCECETDLTYIGLDSSKFNNPISKDWRKDLGIVDKYVLLYVGILEERRSPHFLLDVIKKLPDDYVLLLVGQGPQQEEIMDRIHKEGLEHKVYMLGKLAQEYLPSLYSQSDLFLLASKYEIYGMVILESMFFGLPVVSSKTAGSETIISDKQDGVIVDEFSIERWAEAIINICSDKNLLRRMKNMSSQKINDYYLWDKAACTFLKLYGLS